jgi:hypothetical protein
MNKTKMFLNISIGISIVICSIALLVFSCKDAPANAQTIDVNGYMVVAMHDDWRGDKSCVIGYNPKTGDMKILANKSHMDLFTLK